MTKKAVFIGSTIVLLAAVIALMLWRSHVMGPGARFTAGGLLAISIDRTPMPVPESLSGASKLPDNTALQESGGLLVSLALDPYPPTISKPGNFEIKLTDQDGHVISDATISLDLTMPGMYMPPNQLNMESIGEENIRPLVTSPCAACGASKSSSHLAERCNRYFLTYGYNRAVAQ